MTIDEVDADLTAADAVDGEVVEEEEYETTVEEDLSRALELLEKAVLLNNDLIEDRLKAKNKISYKVGKRITDLTTEIWTFIQATTDGGNGTYVNLEEELDG